MHTKLCSPSSNIAHMSAVYRTPYSPSLDCQDVPKHVNENLIHLNGYLISWGWLREALDRFWLLIKFSVLWPLNLWWSEKINIITKNAASKETMNSTENRSDAFRWSMMKLSKCHGIILRWPIFHDQLFPSPQVFLMLMMLLDHWWWMNKTSTNSKENKMLPKNLKNWMKTTKDKD